MLSKEVEDVDETTSIGTSSHSWGGLGFTKERVEIACGMSKWNLKGVTVRACRIWEVTSVVNVRVKHKGQTIQELI